MLDANSTLDDPSLLLDFLADCGLHNLHSRDPAPSTYIGSPNKRINYIFGCNEASRYVIRSGLLAFTEGPNLTIRVCVFEYHFSNKITGNLELVQLDLSSMLEYYLQHCMVDCTQTIHGEQSYSMDCNELCSALIIWDNDQRRAMELNERNLCRPLQKCSWSRDIRNAAILRRYLLPRLREKLRNEDYTSTFL
jgi:hypothetical protein